MSAIDQKYAELGGPGGVLGAATGGDTPINTPGGGSGLGRQFANGAIYWIDQPNVKSHITEYHDITFSPGDQVIIDAGGCAQTGGHGKTWKRYVDPQGPNADRLYHGLVWVPGGTAGLVRLQGVIGQTLTIPSTSGAAGLYLRLGYEDDGYDDNGYWGREGDDGTGDQCRSMGNAYVIVTVLHAQAAQPTPTHAPFDLVWSAVDDNAIPLNPVWGYQVESPGQVQDVGALCGDDPSQPPCTTQSPSKDIPDGWNGFWCARVGGSVHGHVNWGAATYQGLITWNEHSAPGTDDDYNFELKTPNNAGLTAANNGTLHLEFDSDETIDHFDTPWWNEFHSAVDQSDEAARAMVTDKVAIVTGLMGLDCEHSCTAELHPVWALAIRVNDAPEDETWAIFVRNWGDEGYCSKDQHLLDLYNNQYVFRLPWREGGTAVSASSMNFKTNNQVASGPEVAPAQGAGVFVTFTLPPPEQGARINGELHLAWTVNPNVHHINPVLGIDFTGAFARDPVASRLEGAGGHLLTSVGAAGASQGEPHEGEAEAQLAKLHAQLAPDARAAMLEKLKVPVSNDHMAPAAMQAVTLWPLRIGSEHGTTPPPVRAVYDDRKAAKDKARYLALKEAFGGQVPGYNEGDNPAGGGPGGGLVHHINPLHDLEPRVVEDPGASGQDPTAGGQNR